MDLKSIFKKTPAYRYYKRRQNFQRIKGWDTNDDRLLAFYRSFIKRGDLVFDVGANIGNRVKIFLALGARVVAFEPQKSCAKTLKILFKDHQRFELEELALGSETGQAEMYISNASTISSLSSDWIEKVKSSGRFSGFNWNKKQTVYLSTLDVMLEKHGLPDFIKVDVEGFEAEVIGGLSSQVAGLSFEFSPEVMEGTVNCIRHLSTIGNYIFNYSLEETLQFGLDNWITAVDFINQLDLLKQNPGTNGDIYAKLS